MSAVIGIDLGTSNTCAAISVNGRAKVIRSNLGYQTVPSILTFDAEGKPIVGQRAERRLGLEPNEVIYGSKRLLGRHMLPGAKDYFQPHFAYELVSDGGDIAGHICGQTVSFTQVAAYILEEMRNAAETALNDKVERAVVTVPAYFTNTQRQCVLEAGRLANLEIMRTLNEPTAAALAFGAKQNYRKRVLVFDIGGGTFDVSIVQIDGDIYEVLGVGGDTFLGGLDFDKALVDLFVERSGKIPDADQLTRSSKERIFGAMRDAKHRLSAEKEVDIALPFVELTGGELVDLQQKITRDDLESATGHLVKHSLDIVAETLAELELATSDIHEVLLVGGQSRLPLYQESLREMFGREPSKRVHPDEAVAIGAAIAAEALSHDAETPLLRDALPLPVGIGHAGDEFQAVVPGNSRVPCSFSTSFVIPEGESEVAIPVFQGSSYRSSENEFLGRIRIRELDTTRGNVPIEVRFDVDRECIIRVTASIPGKGVVAEEELSGQLPEEDDVLRDLLPAAQKPKRLREKKATEESISWYQRFLSSFGLGRRSKRRD